MITLTEKAATQIKEMIKGAESSEELYLRIGTKDGGCSGFSYEMGLDTKVNANDEECTQHDVKIVVNKDNISLLQGLVIDFKEAAMGGGFTISNPNATSTCGCGSSFRTEQEAGKPGSC